MEYGWRKTMAPNLRRGLFRVWVVASVIWVLGASIAAYFLLRDDLAVLSGERPDLQEFVRCDGATDEALRPLCDFQDRLQATFRKLDEPRFLERRKEAWSNIRLGGALVFGPPALALLIGSAGFWVIRGFRCG